MVQTNTGEEIIWRDSPSQWSNFRFYFFCVLFCWLVIPIFIAAWRWIETRCFTYELTTERLRTRKGVFAKHTEELELYRVKDSTLSQSFFERILGLGTIVLETSDRTTPQLVMATIKDATQVRELIRERVEAQRQTKHVREID